MFFVFCTRDDLIKHIPKGAVWAEVGVYRGDFSEKVVNLCQPSALHLIDNWRFDIEEHNALGDTSINFSAFAGKIHWQHFGDDPNATQQANFEYVTRRFSQTPSVHIRRSRSTEGMEVFPDGHFDVIYVDANHQYEYVLRDLTVARTKLKHGGILLLNDFYEGPGGAEQNLGVIPAATAFAKRYNFDYIAMTHGTYADIALTNDVTSEFVTRFLQNLKDSELLFIGIPDAIVPNIRYKLYKKANGELRYIAVM